MLSSSDRIAKRRIHHDDTARTCSRNIDIVDTDAGTANNFQIGSRLEDFWRHLGRRADGKSIILTNDSL